MAKNTWSEPAYFPICPVPVKYEPLDPSRSKLDAYGAAVRDSLARLFLEHRPPAPGVPLDVASELARVRAEAAWWRHCFLRWVPARLQRELAREGLRVDAGSVQWEGGRIARVRTGRPARRAKQTASARRARKESRQTEREALRRRVRKLHMMGMTFTAIAIQLRDDGETISRQRVAALVQGR